MRKNTDIIIIATTVPFPVSKAVEVAIALVWVEKKQRNGEISVVKERIKEQDDEGKIIL